MLYDLSECRLCPRECGADRTKTNGLCGCNDKIRVAKAYLHEWEEPCLSVIKGAGTVFFSGCSLRCCYCQNYKISQECFGAEISVERLSQIFLELMDKGADCIDLVSPTHYAVQVISALDMVKSKLTIPVVYNCGGYEKAETLKMLDGYVDVYLPDFKYIEPNTAKEYSDAEDYPEVVVDALREMYRQTGECVTDENGVMRKGLIIRHLVLPNHRHESIRILDKIAEVFPIDKIRLSLMSQYTPFYKSCEHKEINRRISTFEYNKVADHARSLGFIGYMQERSSAKEEYTPDFDLYGI